MRIRIKNDHELVVSGTNQKKITKALPFTKINGASTFIAKRVSSIFTRLALPNLGIEILWGADNRIYLTVAETLFGKVIASIKNHTFKGGAISKYSLTFHHFERGNVRRRQIT